LMNKVIERECITMKILREKREVCIVYWEGFQAQNSTPVLVSN
jgi:hypothetical protein